MKDIQVFTALDAKTVAAEKLDILLLSTEGAVDMATYNDLEKLKAAFPRKKVAAMADKMFNQDNTLADTLIRKVRVAGIENPQNVGGTASRIEIAFGENMPTETLEALPTMPKSAARLWWRSPPARKCRWTAPGWQSCSQERPLRKMV